VQTALVALLCLALPLFWAPRGFCGLWSLIVVWAACCGTALLVIRNDQVSVIGPAGTCWDLLEPALVSLLSTVSLMPVSFQQYLGTCFSPSRRARLLTALHTAHLLAGDPFAATNGPPPSLHLTARVGLFLGSLAGSQLHLFLPSVAGTTVNQPSNSVYSHPQSTVEDSLSLRCHAKIAVFKH
jgi:hypothetical protein